MNQTDQWVHSDSTVEGVGNPTTKLGVAYRLGRVSPPEPVPGCPSVPGCVVRDRRFALDFDGVKAWDADGPGGRSVTLWVVPPALTVPTIPIRHPHVLSTFGGWQSGDSRIVATERPEISLSDRFGDAWAGGSPGLPGDDLVEAIDQIARALDDLIGSVGQNTFRLDPRSLYRVGGRWKLGPLFDPKGEPVGEGRAASRPAVVALATMYARIRIGSPAMSPGGSADERPDLVALPVRERSAVARAVAADPDRRWPTCRAFADAIRTSRFPEAGFVGPEAAQAVAKPGHGQVFGHILSAAAGAAVMAGILATTPRGPAGPPPIRTETTSAPSLVRLQSPTDPPALTASGRLAPPPPTRKDRNPGPASSEPLVARVGHPGNEFDGPDATFDPEFDAAAAPSFGLDPSQLVSDVFDDRHVAPPPPTVRARFDRSLTESSAEGQAPPPPPLRTSGVSAPADRSGDRR